MAKVESNPARFINKINNSITVLISNNKQVNENNFIFKGLLNGWRCKRPPTYQTSLLCCSSGSILHRLDSCAHCPATNITCPRPSQQHEQDSEFINIFQISSLWDRNRNYLIYPHEAPPSSAVNTLSPPFLPPFVHQSILFLK